MSPVYARGPIYGKSPIFVVTEDERRQMLQNGSAEVVSDGAAIRLLLNLDQFRGVSCQMGPRVTENAAFGEEHLSELAKLAALSYLLGMAARDNQLGSYCPLLLR